MIETAMIIFLHQLRKIKMACKNNMISNVTPNCLFVFLSGVFFLKIHPLFSFFTLLENKWY